MGVAENLRTARALIAKGWTQEAWAEDVRGVSCGSRMADAVCYCPEGAIAAAIGMHPADAQYSPEAQALTDAIGGLGDPSEIPSWNDAPGRIKEEVLAAFVRAITQAEAAQCSTPTN
ncbi:MAG: hypothetical protein ACAH27_05975 [Xanthobacteraceae bacterium]